MEYQLLTPRDLVQLRRERLLGLEADHFRARLLLAENPEDSQAQKDIAELARRVECHRQVLDPAPEASVPDMSEAEEYTGVTPPEEEVEAKATTT